MYLGPDYLERRDALERQLVGELRRRLPDTEQPKVRQDLEIMITALEDSIETRRLERNTLLPYWNLPEWIFLQLRAILDPRIDPDRHAAALTRLAGYAGRADGVDPISTLARQRTAEAMADTGLLGPYRGELQDDLDSAPRFMAGMRSLLESSSLAGWEDDFATLEAQLREYTDWLRREMLPRSRASNLLPAPVYANNLKNVGVRATPEALIEQGTAAYQSLRVEMRALAAMIAEQRGWEDGDLLTVIRRLKALQVPQDELLATYQDRLAALETIIRDKNLVTLPKRAAAIRMATEAEAAAIPASFMNPPQLVNNTGQYGEFVLVQRNPAAGPAAQMDDWSHAAIAWALTAHEARPGHELQFARLVEDGVSIARARFAFNSANVEGWGLYAETLVHPYLPLEGQLFSHYSRLLRAARMFLDPMVNTGQLTRDGAASFLEEQLALSPAMAASEADRYAFWAPGQATAYYYGFNKLLALRTEVELRQGDDFDARGFHDFILRQGLLPPEMLREAVLREFAG